MSTPLVTLATVLLLAAPSLKATAVVVFRTPDRIVMASDSMEQRRSGDERDHRRMCKIRAGGRWYSTLSGFSSNRTPPLNVQALVTSAISPTHTLDAARDAIIQQVYPRISDVLTRARDDKAFKWFFTRGEWVSAIVVAGTDATDPTLRVGVFVIILSEVEPFRLTPAWLSCPGSLCADDGALFFGASVDMAGPTISLLKPPRADWVQRGDSAAARRILSAQSSATPTLVTGPFNILEIHTSGAQWVYRDKASTCAALP